MRPFVKEKVLLCASEDLSSFPGLEYVETIFLTVGSERGKLSITNNHAWDKPRWL